MTVQKYNILYFSDLAQEKLLQRHLFNFNHNKYLTRLGAEIMFSFKFPHAVKITLLKIKSFSLYLVVLCFWCIFILVTITFEIFFGKIILCRNNVEKYKNSVKMDMSV